MHRGVFEAGDVTALPANGQRADNVFAYARTHHGRTCITVLPRWTTALADGPIIRPDVWAETAIQLPPQLRQRWHNALTGETHAAAGTLRVSEVFRSVPFALLDVSQPVGA
jgi:(1->4)-alpha-D-glucan 1-alpha-D-glucosylmutase